MLGELVHAHVAGECDGKAGANGAAVDGGDDGHRQGAQREEALVECAHSHGVADGRVAGARLKELEVAASAEALALAGEDDGAQLGGGGERLRKHEKSIRGLGLSGRGCDGDLLLGIGKRALQQMREMTHEIGSNTRAAPAGGGGGGRRRRRAG